MFRRTPSLQRGLFGGDVYVVPRLAPQKIITIRRNQPPEAKPEVKPEVKPQRRKKVKIPKAVRTIVWNTYIGQDQANGKCYVCKSEPISTANFECGHVKAESQGGETTIRNLRPICGHCNKSIGSRNIEEFMNQYGINEKI